MSDVYSTGSSLGHAVWVDGIQLDIVSGDVSAFEAKARDAIASGGDWVGFGQDGYHYSIYVGPSTGLVFRYSEY